MGNQVAKLSNTKKPPAIGMLLTGMYSSGVSTVESKWSSRQSSSKLPGLELRTPDRGFKIKQVGEGAKKGKHGFLISSLKKGAGRGWHRQVWRTHIASLDAIVFVVDSTHDWTKTDNGKKKGYFDNYSVEMSRDELARLLREDLLEGLPLLVLCNKQDLPSAKSPEGIAKSLQVSAVAKDRQWSVVGCSAADRRDKGLQQGLDWLATQTVKRRAPQRELKQVDHDTDSDESASEKSDITSPLSNPRSKAKSPNDLIALLGYDPSSTNTNTTLGRFQPIRSGTACPFAKASKLWGGRSIENDWETTKTLEEQAASNVKALTEFTRRSNAGENLDGFCIELVDQEATGSTPEELGRAVRRLLTALSDLDPNGEAMMRVKYIGSPGWRFRFAKADFFVTTFAPCYPSTSSRYAFGTSRAFLLLQPELSFLRHKLPVDTPHTNWTETKTIRDQTRAAFRKAGREYYIPDTIQYPAAEHIVKPIVDKKGAVVRWWESDSSSLVQMSAE